MRVLLFASAAALALGACGQSGDADQAVAEAPAAEASAEAPPAPPAGPGAGQARLEAQLNELRANNPRLGPDRTAEFAPVAGVAEQRAPNAALLGGVTPSSPDQTRAPIPAETESWKLEEIAAGLDNPWALEFLPDGTILVTERDPGQARIVTQDGTVSAPITGFPAVVSGGGSQGGLFDVALAPDFASSRRIYFAFAEPANDGASTTSLAVAMLPEGASAIENVEILWRQDPAVASPGHFGGRIAIDADQGVLFLTVGERMLPDVRVGAQTTDNTIGKVVRLNLDGSIPSDNPFAGQDGARGEIWSMGHRSPQGADFDPVNGNLWVSEHGPRGGDELNHPEAGKNYGWPEICYCIDYSGLPIGDFEQTRPGLEEPVYFWDPVIAPGGMSFYTGDLFPAWKNDLFVAGQSSMRLSRLVFNADRTRIVGEEWLPVERRVREVKTGPDGALWLITDDDDGAVMRISPQ